MSQNCVTYKFASDSVTKHNNRNNDGTNSNHNNNVWHRLFFASHVLTLLEFKRSLVLIWKLNELWPNELFDFKVRNQMSGEEYKDDSFGFSRGTSLVVSKTKATSNERHYNIIKPPDLQNVLIVSTKEQECDNGENEEKRFIEQLMIEAQQNTHVDSFKQSNAYQHKPTQFNTAQNFVSRSIAAPPPSYYVCRKCKQRGHHYARNCSNDINQYKELNESHNLNTVKGHRFMAPIQDPKNLLFFSSSSTSSSFSLLSSPSTTPLNQTQTNKAPESCLCVFCQEFIFDAHTINCCYTTACFVCLDAFVQTRCVCPYCQCVADSSNLLPNPKQQEIADKTRNEWLNSGVCQQLNRETT